MGVRIEAKAEPIPGYKLIERLGGGGFGEVWKAEAPGGLFKAVKFVYGDLQTASDDGCRAEQELKGLSRVKTVHHPYILSLERFDIIDGQLIIVMELADRTIWDRFQECRGQGLPGIPRRELLDCLLETAEALDLMNIQYQLQHLDIKPQNLFLSHNHIKVADFGLVKDLEGMNGATVTGGVTPVYAAPETFDGRVSRFSDQYSLAIVFQELLTGVRPFTGSTMRQLVLQHLQGTPDLTSLPVADRPMIMRALAKNPDERFPCCLDLIRALEADKKTAQPKVSPAALIDRILPADGAQTTRGIRNKKDYPAQDLDSAQPDAPLSAPAESMPASSLLAAAVGGSVLSSTAAKGQAPAEAKHGKAEAASPPARPRPVQPPRKFEPDILSVPKPAPAVYPQKDDQVNDSGILQPSLVIGLGKLGIDTLRQIRRLLNQEFGQPDASPHLRLIAMDTDPESVQTAVQGDEPTRLRLAEVLHTPLHRPSHYLKIDASLTEGWLDQRMIYRIPRQPTQAGTRSLGRLAFVDNYRTIARRLESELQAICADDTVHELSQHAEVGMRTRVPRIYVVASLAGTTGGGMFVDLAYVMRQMLRRQGYNNAEVVGVFFLPCVGNDAVRRRALANTYAALTELEYFSNGRSVFRARYASTDASGALKAFSEAGPPFQRSYLLRLPEPRSGSLNSMRDPAEVVGQAGEFIFRDLVTTLGKELDLRRQQPHGKDDPPTAAGPTFATVGLCRLVWPRRQIIEQAGRHLCKRLIDRWLSKDAAAQSQEIHDWTQEQWECHGFRVEDLIAKHHEKCEKILKKSPENLCAQIITPLADKLASTGDAEELNVGPAVQAMDQLEKLLGVPEECRVKGPLATEPSVVEKALKEAAAGIADSCDKQLAELIVHNLIEEPRFRLAGAEEALRQFSAIADQSLQSHEQLAKELSERTVLLYQKICKILEAPVQHAAKPVTSIWKGAFLRRTPGEKTSVAADLIDLLKSYAKCCYQSMVLHQITRLYISMRGLLSDQVREVGFCRQRLRELADLVAGVGQDAPVQKPAAREKYLLPEGCVDLKDAIEQVNGQTGPEDLIEFDQVVQQLLTDQFQALVHVCMGPANVVKNLAPALLQEAIRFIEPNLEGTNAAEMYLAQHAYKKHTHNLAHEIKEEIQAIYASASSKLGKGSSSQVKETAIITLPEGKGHDQLRNLLHAGVPGAYVLTSARSDEILFFREQGPLALQELEQFGLIAQEAYRKQKAIDPTILHTREDIPEWQEGVKVEG